MEKLPVVLLSQNTSELRCRGFFVGICSLLELRCQGCFSLELRHRCFVETLLLKMLLAEASLLKLLFQ